MNYRYQYFISNWRNALNSRRFTVEFIVSILILATSLICFSKFEEFIEIRKGIQFTDPLLHTFKAINLTGPIFFMIYGAILVALLSLLNSPHRLMILFEAYALMVLIRIVMMYILPLSPPNGMIFLKDPLVEFFGTKQIMGNDLFFSGHTSSVFLLFLAVPKKIKRLFLVITIATASSVLLQKAHYTVDVLVAPFVAFACYCAVMRLFHRSHKKERYELEFVRF